MRLLLDTHVFIWWDSEPERLSQRALALCKDPANELILSVVSLWEIQIKSQLDKIRVRLPVSELVRTQQETNALRLLPLTAPHVYTLEELPHLHKEPF